MIRLSCVFVALYFLGLPSAFAKIEPIPDYQAPHNVAIAIFGEWHNSPKSGEVQDQLVVEAARGQSRLFFEYIPMEANANSELKRTYLKNWSQDPKILGRLENHVFGMDSQFEKIVSVVGSAYIDRRRGGEHMDESFMESLATGWVKDHFLNQSVFAEPEVEALRAKIPAQDIEGMTKWLIAYSKSNNEQYLEMLLTIHRAGLKWASYENIPPVGPDADLKAFPMGASADEDVESYLKATLPIRNFIMANAVANTICKSSSNLPVNLSIGLTHLNGLTDILQQMLPNHKIVPIDIEH